MKDKKLEEQANVVIDTLVGLKKQLDDYESQNDSLQLKIHSLEQRIRELEADNEDKQKTIDTYLALKPRAKQEKEVVDLLKGLHPQSRSMIEELRKTFGKTVIRLKDPAFIDIVHSKKCDKSVDGTILALSKRMINDTTPALVVNTVPWSGTGNRRVSIKFNF